MSLSQLTPNEVKAIIRPLLVEIAEKFHLILHEDGLSLVEPDTADVRVSIGQYGRMAPYSPPFREYTLHVHIERYHTTQYKLKIFEHTASGYYTKVSMKKLLRRIEAVRGEASKKAEVKELARARERRNYERRKQDIAVLSDWLGLEFKNQVLLDHMYRAKLNDHVIDLNMRYDDEGQAVFKLEITKLDLNQTNATLRHLVEGVRGVAP